MSYKRRQIPAECRQTLQKRWDLRKQRCLKRHLSSKFVYIKRNIFRQFRSKSILSVKTEYKDLLDPYLCFKEIRQRLSNLLG
jgi:hypothetical protein